MALTLADGRPLAWCVVARTGKPEHTVYVAFSAHCKESPSVILPILSRLGLPFSAASHHVSVRPTQPAAWFRHSKWASLSSLYNISARPAVVMKTYILIYLSTHTTTWHFPSRPLREVLKWCSVVWQTRYSCGWQRTEGMCFKMQSAFWGPKSYPIRRHFYLEEVKMGAEAW